MDNILKTLALVCVFFVLTPGVLIQMPIKGGIYKIAAVHALLFGAIYFIVTNVFGVLREGYSPAQLAAISGGQSQAIAAQQAGKAKPVVAKPVAAKPAGPVEKKIKRTGESCGPDYCTKTMAENKEFIYVCVGDKICEKVSSPNRTPKYAFSSNFSTGNKYY